jgi:hypothetical protein
MSRLSLDPEELRVQSFATERALHQPTELTDATTREPATGDNCPTITGCTCIETCPGGVCHY